MRLNDHSYTLVHHVLQLLVKDRIDDALAPCQLTLLPLGKAMQLLDKVLQLRVRDLLIELVKHVRVDTFDLILFAILFLFVVLIVKVIFGSEGYLVHLIYWVFVVVLRVSWSKSLASLLTSLLLSHLAQTHF